VSIFNSSTTGFTGLVGKYDVGRVVEAILKSPEFYSAPVYRAGMKTPAEVLITAIRNLGLDLDVTSPTSGVLPNQMALMGEQLFQPPDVAGYPGGAAWFSDTTYFNRMNFFNGVVRPFGAYVTPTLSHTAISNALASKTAGALVDYLLGLLVEGAANVQTAARQAILDYVSGGDPNAALPSDDATLSTKVRGAAYLALALPEFQVS
jgi:hypothetical protein